MISALRSFTRNAKSTYLAANRIPVSGLFISTKVNMADKPVETAIRTKLTDKLKPVHLQVINESYMHNVPKGSESHFKVVIVSDLFENKPLIQRHRMVNEALEEELNTSVHALSIQAKPTSQWDGKERSVSPSPACRGGFGK